MPTDGRPMKMFGDRNLATKIVATVLVLSGLGGVTVRLAPMPWHAEVAVEHLVEGAPTTTTAAAATNPPAGVTDPPAAATNPPAVVTKDSSTQDIVKAIVGRGQVAGLSEDQIKTVIATAKIESGFRPTVSGGVQPYGGRGGAADEVIGLFQEKASFGTVAEREDPDKAITRFIARFIEAYEKHAITSDHVQAATLAQNPQLLKHNGGVGTGYYKTIQAAMGAATVLYGEAVDAMPQPAT